MMRDLFRDVRFALRNWRRSPAVAAVSMSTLAIAIGATTAVFSVVEAVVLRPLPYAQPERLVAIWDGHVTSPNLAKIFASYDDFDAWRRDAHSFEQVAAATWAANQPVLTGRGTPRLVVALPATIDLFRVLGVAAEVGRTFDADDENRGCVVVLAHRFWRSTFDSSPAIVGRSIALDDRACTVVGVMPATFVFYPETTDAWRVITATREPLPTDGYQGVGVFARLKPGVTIEAAQAEVSALHVRLHEHDPHGAAFVPTVYPLQGEFTWLAGRNLRLTLWVLFAAVSVVLLLACVNVATLLLGRATLRRREFAVRAALGSGRWRLARQVLIESLTLSGGAAVVGLLLAGGALRWLRALAPIELPPGAVVAIDWRVLAFAVGLTASTALIFGIAPAWRASHADISAQLKAGAGPRGAGTSRRSAALFVAAEIGCAMVLLVVAGLLTESVVRLGSAPLGFRSDGLLTMTVTPPRAKYTTVAGRIELYDRLLAATGGAAGVQGAAISSTFLRGRSNSVLLVDGRPNPPPDTRPPDVSFDIVSDDYFRVLGIPLLAGRTFTAADRHDAAAVSIINDALAREYFPGENPIGRRIRTSTSPWTTIVGVVGNQKTTAVFEEMNWVTPRFVYRPYEQGAPAEATLAVRASGTAALAPTIQRVIGTVDADIPLTNVQTVRQWISKDLAYPQFRAAVLGGFAAVALLLALVGLYAVLAQLVAQRTYEFGVRIALGATPRDIARNVARHGAVPAAIGIAAGVAVTLAAERVLNSLLFGIAAAGAVTLATVGAVLLMLSAIAMAIPARRATQVDPIMALRSDSA